MLLSSRDYLPAAGCWFWLCLLIFGFQCARVCRLVVLSQVLLLLLPLAFASQGAPSVEMIWFCLCAPMGELAGASAALVASEGESESALVAALGWPADWRERSQPRGAAAVAVAAAAAAAAAAVG